MYLSKEKFESILEENNLCCEAFEALKFVQEILEAEAEALKEKEPYATASIERLNTAAYEVFSICGEVDNEEFGK